MHNLVRFLLWLFLEIKPGQPLVMITSRVNVGHHAGGIN